MKKSSRDYRKYNRKKWIIINAQLRDVALSLANGAHALSIIESQIGLSKTDKYLKISQQVIHTAQQISKTFINA